MHPLPAHSSHIPTQLCVNHFSTDQPHANPTHTIRDGTPTSAHPQMTWLFSASMKVKCWKCSLVALVTYWPPTPPLEAHPQEQCAIGNCNRNCTSRVDLPPPTPVHLWAMSIQTTQPPLKECVWNFTRFPRGACHRRVAASRVSTSKTNHLSFSPSLSPNCIWMHFSGKHGSPTPPRLTT